MLRVLHRPDGAPNRTERQMAAELSGVPGLLFLNVYLAQGTRQRELDGLLVTPEGIATLEAKADPRHRGELVVSRNDVWRIGGEVADFAGSSNPMRQTREAAQVLTSLLSGVEDLVLPRVQAVTYVAGEVTLPSGIEPLGDVLVAVTGHLARGVQEALATHAQSLRSRSPVPGPLLGVEDVRSLARVLDLPVSLLPGDEDLLALGFPAGSVQAEHASAARDRESQEWDEELARHRDRIEQMDRAAAARQQVWDEDRQARAEQVRTRTLRQHLRRALQTEYQVVAGVERRGDDPYSVTAPVLDGKHPLVLVARSDDHPCTGRGCAGPVVVTLEGSVDQPPGRLPGPLPYRVSSRRGLYDWLRQVRVDGADGDEWRILRHTNYAGDAPLPSVDPVERAKEEAVAAEARRRREVADRDRLRREESLTKRVGRWLGR